VRAQVRCYQGQAQERVVSPDEGLREFVWAKWDMAGVIE